MLHSRQDPAGDVGDVGDVVPVPSQGRRGAGFSRPRVSALVSWEEPDAVAREPGRRVMNPLAVPLVREEGGAPGVPAPGTGTTREVMGTQLAPLFSGKGEAPGLKPAASRP